MSMNKKLYVVEFIDYLHCAPEISLRIYDSLEEAKLEMRKFLNDYCPEIKSSGKPTEEWKDTDGRTIEECIAMRKFYVEDLFYIRIYETWLTEPLSIASY